MSGVICSQYVTVHFKWGGNLSLVTLTFYLWPWHSNSSERGTKQEHVFPVNLAQIRSAVPEIGLFDLQTKHEWTRNVGQCPTWWPPCRIYVAPSVQRRKVWLTLTTWLPCSNAVKTRKPLKFGGVPQTGQPISAGGPKFTILWGHVEDILLLNKFFSDCRYVP